MNLPKFLHENFRLLNLIRSSNKTNIWLVEELSSSQKFLLKVINRTGLLYSQIAGIRDLVQRELSELEDTPNLWLTEKYCGNKRDIYIRSGNGFGGYPDWPHSDFDAKISIREDHLNDYKVFDVGTFGLCIYCGDEISSGLYCDSCDPDENEYCQECDEYYSETWEVINRHGERINVCEHCLNNHYRFCEHCEEYHPVEQVIETGNGDFVCKHCIENDFMLCDVCNEYYLADEVESAIDANGERVYVCRHCRKNNYVSCEDCGEFIHVDLIKDGLCPNCHEDDEEISA